MINGIQTEEKDYVRDLTTRALINTNTKALHEHRMKKEQAARIDKLESDMKCIMTTMLEICQAVKELGTGK